MKKENSKSVLDVAERAVLTSCSLNSISGRKMTVVGMDAEQRGYCSTVLTLSGNSEPVSLYLPQEQQVMSVHIPFDSYHPNLALVHRQSGITEYVLKDTGQVVGDESCGISPLWQGLLGCNDRGDKDDERMEEFWKDWETRLWT